MMSLEYMKLQLACNAQCLLESDRENMQDLAQCVSLIYTTEIGHY